ncbi:TPA: trigger factor [Candidatus Uhrbacteria bacterium]|nr:trigger factor [Candidatus Uhrbacteria bacterium]HCU31607.1 trigger factor [Candidatus Uhrbacteria bacterium]
MSQVQTEILPKNSMKLTITVSVEEIKPHLEHAAEHISEHKEIAGFRPGKANYEAVKQSVGEMAIYEEALENIVRQTFVEALTANNIEPVGSPAIDIEKMVPGNELVYTATIALMPAVEQLADYRTLKITAKEVGVEDKDIDLALQDLQRMQTKEVRAEAGVAATKDNKVVIDMNIKKDNVPLDGGQALGHAVYLAEAHYIPGFAEELVGVKEGDIKNFTLKFPEEHYQKHLAGQECLFEVEVKELYRLEPPQLDDTFAAALGQKDLGSLKTIIRDNMRKEKESEETIRQERELLELLAKESRFQDIPDLLLNEEINKMIEELKHGVEEQGMIFEEYLKNVIKKSLADIKLDFTPQAINRIKVALVIKEVAKKENIKASDEEINDELDHLAKHYEENKEAKDRVYSPAYRDYLEAIMRNRKVIEFLKELMVGGKKAEETQKAIEAKEDVKETKTEEDVKTEEV